MIDLDVEGLQGYRVLEARCQEIREYAKVGELNELRKSIEYLQYHMDTRDEHVRTPSLDHERQPIPVYYGKHETWQHFFIFPTGLCRRASRKH